MTRKVFGGITLVLIILTSSVYFVYRNATKASAFRHDTVIEIEKGDSFNKIINKLVEKGLTVNPLWLKILAYRENVADKLKVGEYELKQQVTLPEILSVFVEGKSKKYAITFPEGWSLKEVLEALKKHQNLKTTLSNDMMTIPAQLDMPEKHPEGWFFPDTYFFEKNATDSSILKRAYNKMRTVLAEEWEQKEQNLPYQSAYEALIMASIIEKETGSDSERPMIAGVFVRRLAKGMLLQTDPTVIYGMGDRYTGNIKASDLTTATPYNTYVIQGLPPTPIAMPGRDAIHAALHPDKEEYLYFVAKGDGSHQFSKTMAEHNRAVSLFQKHKK